ncbi:MAG: DUF503 domain-containing protein [Deltaproteobacteria bacterium]|nr:DUF503 domain-containing protein [Deltaproteobacteria bacterium]
MLVGIVKLDVHFPYCHSLKEKRQQLNKIKGRTAAKFSVNISEVEHQDTWQRSQIGFALVGSDHGFIESLTDQILRFIEGLGLGDVLDCQREVISF